jgi:hypothetical protein
MRNLTDIYGQTYRYGEGKVIDPFGRLHHYTNDTLTDCYGRQHTFRNGRTIDCHSRIGQYTNTAFTDHLNRVHPLQELPDELAAYLAFVVCEDDQSL